MPATDVGRCLPRPMDGTGDAYVTEMAESAMRLLQDHT